MIDPSKYKVILVDDHQIVLDGLKNIIQNNKAFEVVATAKNGRDALTLIKALKPDLVLLDIDMPLMNGIVVAEEMQKEELATKVVILSLHHEHSIIKHLISVGIDGYLLKNSDKSELLDAMLLVCQGQNYFSTDVTLSLAKENDKKNALNSIKSDSVLIAELTSREKEIFLLLCEGLTNRELGAKLFISSRTVDAHRANIMKKLGVKNVVGLVKLAMRNGLI